MNVGLATRSPDYNPPKRASKRYAIALTSEYCKGYLWTSLNVAIVMTVNRVPKTAIISTPIIIITNIGYIINV